MESRRRFRHKAVEWVRRYLPNELAGWVGELGGAAATYYLTGSYAAAVIAGTVGASVGYYATAYVNGVRWSYRAQAGLRWPNRVLIANVLAIRSIAADVAFYVMAIFSYERFANLLVRPQTAHA
jgi:hypothetical protein